MSPGPFHWRGWLNCLWMSECISAHGFMDRVQSVTSFIAFSAQTRVGSSTVHFDHASCPPSCSDHGRSSSQIRMLTTLTSYRVWMSVDIKLLLHSGTPRLQQQLTFRNVQRKSNLVQVGIEYIYIANYVCIYRGLQLKSEFQHTETWSAAAWPPCRLCYRPAVFSCHILLIPLSLLQGETRPMFQG